MRVGGLDAYAGTDARAVVDLCAPMQGGVPGYCGDRYYRAAAGGQYCSKFDVR